MAAPTLSLDAVLTAGVGCLCAGGLKRKRVVMAEYVGEADEMGNMGFKKRKSLPGQRPPGFGGPMHGGYGRVSCLKGRLSPAVAVPSRGELASGAASLHGSTSAVV
jgi:hypothetical protein